MQELTVAEVDVPASPPRRSTRWATPLARAVGGFRDALTRFVRIYSFLSQVVGDGEVSTVFSLAAPAGSRRRSRCRRSSPS
ncbi:MAG: hypothetical protein H0V33_04775 [Acidimicrobiia bacterium]|nr:hypothetical protein [Acidimicrobiia bacterium]